MLDTIELKAQMVRKGLSQQRLANLLGMSSKSLNAKLNGRSEFSLADAECLIEILSLEKPDDIFFAKPVT